MFPKYRGEMAACWRLNRLLGACLLLCATLVAFAGCATSSQPTGKAPPAAPTAVVEGPLASVVAPVSAPQARSVTTSYDASAQVAKVTITIAAAPDVATAQTRVMKLCFDVQKAVWASNRALREVKVIVLGPIRDDYANIIDDAYGVADVLAGTAGKLPWDTLTADGAWSRYDSTWLRPTYTPNWLYGKNN